MGFFDFLKGGAGAALPQARVVKYLGDGRVKLMRQQLERGDWASVDARIEQSKEWDERAFFIDCITEAKGRPAWIDAWTEAKPDSALAWTVRGRHSTVWAWEARSSGRAEDVAEGAWPVFMARLEAAQQELKRAADLAPDDPNPWNFLVTIAMGLDRDLTERIAMFEQACARDPFHVMAHRALCAAVSEKWGGSHEAALEHATEGSAKAPPGSGVHAIVAHAHLEVWFYLGAFENDWDAAAEWMRQDAVRTDLVAAHDSFRQNPTMPLSLGASNEMAMALSMVGELGRAAEEMTRMAGQVTEYPWRHLDEPIAAYEKAKKRCF